MFRKFSKAYKKYKERRSGSQETSSGVTSTAAAPTPDDSSAWDTADSSQFRTSLSSAFKRKKGREGHSHSSSDPTPLRYARDLLDGPTVTLAAVPPRSKLKPPADTSPLSPGARGEKWEKVLWKTTSFPDNYTDQTFLKELVINADVVKRDFWQVVVGSAAITQQLCTVATAVATPLHIRYGNFPAGQVLLACAALLVIGYAICVRLGGHVLGGSLPRGIRLVSLLTGGVYLLSPLLHSLMATISEDTVIALTAFLLITHLYLHDYSFVNSVTDKLTGTLSLGAAVFASVLIASGMPTDFDVFVHVLLSLELYLLSPFIRRYVRQASVAAHLAVSAALLVASAALLAPLSRIITGLFLVAVALVSFVAPWCLVRIHKFKAKINGPWDEAVPQIPTALTTQFRRKLIL